MSEISISSGLFKSTSVNIVPQTKKKAIFKLGSDIATYGVFDLTDPKYVTEHQQGIFLRLHINPSEQSIVIGKTWGHQSLDWSYENTQNLTVRLDNDNHTKDNIGRRKTRKIAKVPMREVFSGSDTEGENLSAYLNLLLMCKPIKATVFDAGMILEVLHKEGDEGEDQTYFITLDFFPRTEKDDNAPGINQTSILVSQCSAKAFLGLSIIATDTATSVFIQELLTLPMKDRRLAIKDSRSTIRLLKQ